MRLFLSFLFGLIPETLYFTLFITYIKNIKEKRLLLFISIAFLYFICVLIQRWQILFYISIIALIYLACKLIYKKRFQIIDIFIISFACLWITILSSLFILIVKSDMSNYMQVYFLERIFLFFPFLFKNKFNIIYKKYCKLWNRNDKEKRPIKSITLRNISLILLNSFILFLNIAIINITNFVNKGGI